MKERGFTLIEVALVLCIIGLLTVIGTVKFHELELRSRRDAEIRMVHAEILNTRLAAMTQRDSRRFKVGRSFFEVYSSTADSGTVAPVKREELPFPLTHNNTGVIDFDNSGTTFDECSICFEDDTDGAVDSVVVNQTRVSFGKKRPGKDCNSENIAKQ